MAKVTELTAELAEPIVVENGCSLWDVEYLKEAGDWYLRLYIDKEGGVSINDCEAVSRAVSDALDEADPIEAGYIFEVSSAGADRALKKPEHFEKCMGQDVDVKLYRALEGKKELTGALVAHVDGKTTVETATGSVTLEKKDIAQIRLRVTF